MICHLLYSHLFNKGREVLSNVNGKKCNIGMQMLYKLRIQTSIAENLAKDTCGWSIQGTTIAAINTKEIRTKRALYKMTIRLRCLLFLMERICGRICLLGLSQNSISE